MSRSKWLQIENKMYLQQIGRGVKSLPSKVYRLDEEKKNLYLEYMQDSFTFDYKLYNTEKTFIKRVLNTWNNSSGNMGILLSGVQGTGKTVTAKLICNELKLPVIVVSKFYSKLPEFINSISQDLIILIDEYDKIYSTSDYDSDDDSDSDGGKSHNMLTVMDGVLSGSGRRMFILTSNEIYIHSKMKERPGRIRYIKKFDDMDYNSIVEIVDDKLTKVQFREAILQFLSTLNTITVDIVKAVVDEVNIHEEAPEEFRDVLNIKTIDDIYDIYFKDIDGEFKKVYSAVEVSPSDFNAKRIVGYHLIVNGESIGHIKSVMGKNTIKLELLEKDGKRIMVEAQMKRVEGTHDSFIKYKKFVL